MKAQDFNKLTDRQKLDYLHETGKQMRAAQKQLNKVKKAGLVTYWANAVMNWQDMYDTLIIEHQKVIDAEKALGPDKVAEIREGGRNSGKTAMLERALDQDTPPESLVR